MSMRGEVFVDGETDLLELKMAAPRDSLPRHMTVL